MTITQINFPTRIRFGVGASKEVGVVLHSAGLSRPLIVTDQRLADLPMIAEMRSRLESQDLIPTVYSGVVGNPVVSQVDEGVKAYHEHGADSIVIVGGGASLDVGKVIALMANHPGSLLDYEDGKEGARPVDQPIPFMIAIPTTAGTGSEVGRASVISDDKTKEKKIIFDPKLLVPVVLADPELTLSLPPDVTAATGFDALTHNVEAYLACGFHPICDGIAWEGTRLIGQHLAKAFANPGDLEARGGMLMASMMGAIAFQKGLGVTHSCAHALSTVFDTHHGLANAVMLRACMSFNRVVAEDRLARLGQAVGCKGTDQGALATGFLDWIDELAVSVKIPRSLKDIGASVTDRLVEVAFNDPVHGGNPRPVTKDDIRDLFEAAKG